MAQQYNIERRKLSEQVAVYLERDILEERLRPGDQLPSERALMEQFGVGRPAIREALFSLQKMGLIALSSGTRARVIRPTPEVVLGELSGVMRHLLARPEGQRHVQEVRALFEGAMVRYAAVHACADDLERLREALASNRDAIGDEARFKKSDVAFHRVLAGIANNPVCIAVHDALAQWLDDQRAVALEEEGQDEVAYHAHARIVDAIASGDPEAADGAMSAHLDQHYDIYRRLTDRVHE